MEIGLPRGLFVASAHACLQVGGGFGGKCWLQVPLSVSLCGEQVMELIFKEKICLCCKRKAWKVLGVYKRAASAGEGGGSACRAVLTEPPVPEMGGRPGWLHSPLLGSWCIC